MPGRLIHHSGRGLLTLGRKWFIIIIHDKKSSNTAAKIETLHMEFMDLRVNATILLRPAEDYSTYY